MYDLEGADSGREWVELFNTGTESVSLTDWKLFENGTNHKLTLITGSETIGSGEYIVIADNSEKFLIDWPGFSGTLFDSAFSLSNSGETLTVRDSALVDVDSYTYSSETGAQGDGNALSKQNDGVWLSAAATPGSGSLQTSLPQEVSSEPEENNTPVTQSSFGMSFPVTPQIFADAGDDRIVIVGADSVFEADGWGIEGKPLVNARFYWNFGDGSFKEGKKVLHHYDFPGSYVAMLHVSSDVYSATDSFIVTADPAELAITMRDAERVVVTNDAGYRVDISGWMVREGSTFFVFPEGMMLLPETSVSISHEVSGLSGSGSTLLYPNGSVVIGSAVEKQIETPITPPTKQAQAIQTIVGTMVSENTQEINQLAEEAESDKEEQLHANQVASVSGSERGHATLWYILLTFLLAIGAGATYFLVKNKEEFEIIDESED